MLPVCTCGIRLCTSIKWAQVFEIAYKLTYTLLVTIKVVIFFITQNEQEKSLEPRRFGSIEKVDIEDKSMYTVLSRSTFLKSFTCSKNSVFYLVVKFFITILFKKR